MMNSKTSIDKQEAQAANRDPITGAPGAHPVGAGLGAAAGGLTGAAIGTVGGPIGAVVGAAVGAVAGGLAGKAAAESVDPTIESAYWKDHYMQRPYVESEALFTDYEPAYRYGWESAERYRGRTIDEVERDLGRDWETRRGTSKLTWNKARAATRDAWDHVTQTKG